MSGRHIALSLLILITSVAAQWSTTMSLSVSAGTIPTLGNVSSSGLRLWTDSSETATLGLAPRVRFWFDKSGEARHLGALSSGVAPYATVVSGTGQVIFEDNGLSIAQPIPLSSITAFFVLRGGIDTGYHPLLGRMDRASGLVVESKRIRSFNSGASNSSGIIGSINTDTILMIRMNSSSTDYASINGGTEYSFSYGGNDSATHIGVIYTSSAMRYLRASLSEVAIWDRALTAAERTSVIRALGTKWGITVP
ncbi:MAG: hypothetical protein DWI49_04315 [Chloroflexi bacterium]|nr:MAG: hypothetical protein DWI49_04315 [Chloroflexota bacterium]